MTIDTEKLRTALEGQGCSVDDPRKLNWPIIHEAARAYLDLMDSGMMLAKLPEWWRYETIEYFKTRGVRAWRVKLYNARNPHVRITFGPTPLAASLAAVEKIT